MTSEASRRGNAARKAAGPPSWARNLVVVTLIVANGGRRPWLAWGARIFVSMLETAVALAVAAVAGGACQIVGRPFALWARGPAVRCGHGAAQNASGRCGLAAVRRRLALDQGDFYPDRDRNASTQNRYGAFAGAVGASRWQDESCNLGRGRAGPEVAPRSWRAGCWSVRRAVQYKSRVLSRRMAIMVEHPVGHRRFDGEIATFHAAAAPASRGTVSSTISPKSARKASTPIPR